MNAYRWAGGPVRDLEPHMQHGGRTKKDEAIHSILTKYNYPVGLWKRTRRYWQNARNSMQRRKCSVSLYPKTCELKF